ncbi:hypothetical protein K449DRAFT_401828 [Hypoxylon sp. EC38]|nr:hypothetical protein K449DRAFT_401828 [Hypoxylon sp. EC38]
MARSFTREREHISKEDYLGEFWKRVHQVNTKNASAGMALNSPAKTRALYCDLDEQRFLTLSDVPSLLRPRVKEIASVVIVENISPDWIALLGTTLNIDVNFFCEHMQNLTGPSPWKAVFSSSPIEQKRPMHNIHKVFDVGTHLDATKESGNPTRVSWHVDGVFHLGHLDREPPQSNLLQNPNFIHRRLEYHMPYGWQAATRISYYQMNKNLSRNENFYANHIRIIVLFLIDAPMTSSLNNQTQLSMSMARLHLPVSDNRGGLVMPQLFGRPHYSLFENLKQFFTHSWHFDVLHSRVLSADTVLYLMVASTWAANLRHADDHIKRISFEDIRRPSIGINDNLHECRQTLAMLRTEVSKARKWMPQLVREELEEIRQMIPRRGYVGFPDAIFDEILAETGAAEKFLMDTFQLLMSSITVLDSETSIQQAHYGQKLAQLAMIYVPLSFVTGIFGMNIKEINGAKVPGWVCLAALAVTVVSTVAVFGAYNVWEERTRRKRK